MAFARASQTAPVIDAASACGAPSRRLHRARPPALRPAAAAAARRRCCHLASAAGGANGSSRSSEVRSLSPPAPEQTVGVVIVDHGSRKAESNDMLHEFAELYRWVYRSSRRGTTHVCRHVLAAGPACVPPGLWQRPARRIVEPQGGVMQGSLDGQQGSTQQSTGMGQDWGAAGLC